MSELEVEILSRLASIEMMLAKICGQPPPAMPVVGLTGNAARLNNLVRQDRGAAVAEAKRLAREDTIARAAAKRRKIEDAGGKNKTKPAGATPCR